jgi:hypothetical protein
LIVFYALSTAGAYANATVPPFVERSEIDAKTLQEVHQLIADSAATYLKGLSLCARLEGNRQWPGGQGVAAELTDQFPSDPGADRGGDETALRRRRGWAIERLAP